MRRRDFLMRSGLTAAAIGTAKVADAATALPKPAFLSRIVEINIACPWKPDKRGLAAEAAELAYRLEKGSGGRLLVTLDKKPRTREDVLASEDTVFYGPAQNATALHPAFGFFAGLPGEAGLSEDLLPSWLGAAGGQPLWDEISADFGFKSLLAGHTGPAPGLWSVRRIRSLNDLVKERIYTQGLAREVVRGIGCVPAEAAPDETISQLSFGRIVAAEWGNANHSLAAGLPTLAKYCAKGAIHPHGWALALTIPQTLWQRFGPDLQSSVAQTAAEAAERARLSRHHDALLERAFADTLQVDFVKMPGDIAAAISRVSGAVIADVAARDSLSRRVNQSYLAFRRVALNGFSSAGA